MKKNVPKFLEKKVPPKEEPEQEPEQSQEPEQPEQPEQPEEQEDSPEETEESEDLEETEEEDPEEKEETEEELALRTKREKFYFLNPLNFNHQLLVSFTNVTNALDSINTTLQETNKNTKNLGAVIEDLLEKLDK